MSNQIEKLIQLRSDDAWIPFERQNCLLDFDFAVYGWVAAINKSSLARNKNNFSLNVKTG